jgi:N-acetylglucosaminyldiphosphoundecaprenol N-acetyl-beta-D-mannosaminyltransferase
MGEAGSCTEKLRTNPDRLAFQTNSILNESRAHRDGSGQIKDLPTIELQGLKIHAITESQAIEYLLGCLDVGQGGWAITPNLDHLRRLRTDKALGMAYKTANLMVADGMPLIWASRLQGTPLPERVAGSSLISTLSAAAAARSRSIFLLGGDPGTADQAADVLRQRHTNIRIIGTYCPPVGFEKEEVQVQELIRILRQADPDIVFVALGSPKQEWLIDRIRAQLPKAWWLGIGISFSFLSGRVRRAPVWMQRTGLEWLHRLIQEPRRLAKRYLAQGLPYAMCLLAGCAMRRLSRRL